MTTIRRFIFTLCLLQTTFSIFAHPGIGIVEDSKGNIFYTDLKQVWKIARDRSKTIVVSNVHTHELFLDEKDNLFGEHLWYNGEAANTWGHYVWRLSADNKFEKIIPDTEGFRENYSFVRDHVGRMIWAERRGDCQRLIRKNSDNSTSAVTDQCFKNIRWIRSGCDGTIYVVDFTDLKKIDKQGKMKTVGSKIDERKLMQFHVGDHHAVYGVWDDKDGNIYTAIYSGRMVKKFTPQGKEEIVAETSIPWSPTGGLVDREGNLWLLESSITNSVRVEKISKDGSRKTF